MGLIASLTVAVTVSVGAGENFYQMESWQGPTEADLTVCASMANDLNAGFDYMIRQGLNKDWQSKTATCEIILIGGDDEDEAIAAVPKVAFRF